eukprot:COSAG02_NODE_5440_length_4328_cov_4.242374_1_plen_28_part_10
MYEKQTYKENLTNIEMYAQAVVSPLVWA